jgi:WD40 repeat protein
MTRLMVSTALFVTLSSLASAAPVPVGPADPTKDRDGNPLPKGATARLGSRPFHSKGWYALAFSADGKHLLAFPDAEQVRAWDADTGKTLPGMPLKWGKESDGEETTANTIAGNRTIWVTQSVNRAAPGRIDRDAVSTAYSFSLTDGKEVSRVQFTGRVHFDVMAHRTWNAAASDDGKYLAVAPGSNKAVEVFDLEAGKRLHTQKLTGTGEPGVYISPDAKTLFVLEYKQPIRRFKLVSGKELPVVADTADPIDLIAASPDGKWLLTRGVNTRREEKGQEVNDDFLVARDTIANKTVGKLELGGSPLDFGFAGSESVIVLAAKFRPPLPPLYTLSRWNATTLKREWEVSGPDLPYKFSLRLIVAPGSKRFAFTDNLNFVHVHDAATGKRLIEPSGHDAWVSWVGFSADGERVTTVGRDGLRTWTPAGERKSVTSLPELARGRIQPTQFGEHLVWVSYSEDGKKAELIGWNQAKGEIGWRMPVDDEEYDRILTNDGKRVVRLWPQKKSPRWDVAVYDGPAGKKLHTWSFEPDRIDSGGLAGCGAVGPDDSQAFEPDRIDSGGLGPTALSPDGETLYVGGKGMAALDVKSGKEKSRREIGNIGRVESYSNSPLAFSPDGSRLALASRNVRGRGETLRVYDVKTGKSLVEHDLGEVYKPGVRFSPNGKQIAVWDVWSTTLRVYDAESSLTEPRKLEGSDRSPQCVAFSPNGASLVVGYQDGTALVWDLTAK